MCDIYLCARSFQTCGNFSKKYLPITFPFLRYFLGRLLFVTVKQTLIDYSQKKFLCKINLKHLNLIQNAYQVMIILLRIYCLYHQNYDINIFQYSIHSIRIMLSKKLFIILLLVALVCAKKVHQRDNLWFLSTTQMISGQR